MWNTRTPPASVAGKSPSVPASGRAAIYRVSVNPGAPEPEAIVAEAYNAAVSPNGRWLAYVIRENGQDEVYVQSFDAKGGRAQVSTSGGVEPHWSPDGRALYYLQYDQLVTVPVEHGAAFLPGRPRVLFGGVAQVLTDSVETWHVSPKGDRFIMMRAADDRATVGEVRLDLNWFAQLRRLGAAGR